jgi:hypothetical protein
LGLQELAVKSKYYTKNVPFLRPWITKIQMIGHRKKKTENPNNQPE